MTINRNLFKAILIIVGVLMISGIAVVMTLTLDEPVFFSHYYDLGVPRDMIQGQRTSFRLQYISNSQDTRTVTAVVFDDHPDIQIHATKYPGNAVFSWNAGPQESGEVYGRYRVHTVHCELVGAPDTATIDGIQLSRARIQFNDGSHMRADLGNIHLYLREGNRAPLDHRSSSGSSDGTSETLYKVEENLQLESIEGTLFSQMADRIRLEVNGRPVEEADGMRLEKGDRLRLTARIAPIEASSDAYTLFDVQPLITWVDDQGERYTQRVYNLSNLYNDYDFYRLYNYLKERGAY